MKFKFLNYLSIFLIQAIVIGQNNKIDEHLDDEKKLINFMANFPKLIERPIIIRNEKAVIGRPIENIFKLI